MDKEAIAAIWGAAIGGGIGVLSQFGNRLWDASQSRRTRDHRWDSYMLNVYMILSSNLNALELCASYIAPQPGTTKVFNVEEALCVYKANMFIELKLCSSMVETMPDEKCVPVKYAQALSRIQQCDRSIYTVNATFAGWRSAEKDTLQGFVPSVEQHVDDAVREHVITMTAMRTCRLLGRFHDSLPDQELQEVLTHLQGLDYPIDKWKCGDTSARRVVDRQLPYADC